MFEQQLTATGEYARLNAALQSPGAAALFGMQPAGRAVLYAALSAQEHTPLVVVTAGEADAVRMAADLETLGLRAGVFPARDLVLRPVEGAGRELEYRRLKILGELAGGRLDAVCLSAESLLLRTVPPADFRAATLTLRPGMEIAQETLLETLLAAGYLRRPQVDGPGQFSVRGGIVDLYAPDMPAPARIEFWGDEIDTIHSFDLVSQRRDAALEKIYLSPAREVLFGDPAGAAALLRSAAAKAKSPARHKLEQAMEQDLSLLDSGVVPVAMDKYLPLRYETTASILDHLPGAALVLDEYSAIREALHGAAFRQAEEIKTLLKEGVLAPGLTELYLDEAWLAGRIAALPSLVCENFARSMLDLFLKDLINAPAHPLPAWTGEVKALAEDLRPLIAQNYAVTVLAGTARAAEAIGRDLEKDGFSLSDAPVAGRVQVIPGMLSAGADSRLPGWR